MALAGGLAAGRALGWGSDRLSAGAVAERAAAFAAAPPLTAEDAGTTAAALPLPPPQRDAIAARLKGGSLRLGVVALWDDQAVDGDVVEVESAGYRVLVTLGKEPVPVVLPLDGAGITVIGSDEGRGGGITVGLAAGGRTLALPLLAPGQAVAVRLR